MLLAVGLVACKSMQQEEENGERQTTQRRATIGPDVAVPAEHIKTIQLYRGEDERSLPVMTLEGGAALTLEFDLMDEQGRPLSIYFEHADRTWRRDLSGSQVLESFQDDRLLNYRPSRGTDVSYVHYQYRFPNDDIRFRMSGNYVLRVTERGRRDSVLLEQAFFITEQAGQLRLGSEALMMPSQQHPSIQPVARFTPPLEIRGDPFGYTVCFVRNGRLPDARCEERPQLVSQPELEFELERSRAFAPVTADYSLDLSSLQASSRIARTDRTVSPMLVVLDPDYARFDEATRSVNANGQIVVREALNGYADPALSAEYVRTTFAYVPSNQRPVQGDIVVAGSFSGMDPARGTTMEWVGGRSQYEGTVLLKQGAYEYFYASSGGALGDDLGRSRPRGTSTYTAFVYYRDARRDTDRLLRVNGFTR